MKMSLIEDLVAAYRILAEHGVIDAYGHVSVRSDRDPNRYLLSRSLAPETVMPGDIMEYDLDSNPIDPRGRESVRERFIHGEIYKARSDVNAVVHNHSPSVVPCSAHARPRVGHRGRKPAARRGAQHLPRNERAHAASGDRDRGVRRKNHLPRRAGSRGFGSRPGLQARLAPVAGEGACRPQTPSMSRAASHRTIRS